MSREEGIRDETRETKQQTAAAAGVPRAQSAQTRRQPSAFERVPQPPEFLRPDYRRRRQAERWSPPAPSTSNYTENSATGGNKTAAAAVGKAIAQRAIAAGIKEVVFDRREYKYHGRVAALADAAREAGLKF